MSVKKKRRTDSKEPNLSIAMFRGELGIVRLRLEPLATLYAVAHDEGGWQSSGSGVHVSGGSHSDATAAAMSSPFQTNRREDCRLAVGWVREAATALKKAEDALLGYQVEQPETVDPKATITQAELSDRIDRRRPRIRVWRAGDEEKVR